jgi:hypothetical protein
VVRIGLTQPRVRLVRVAAPELFVIDGLDLLTGLSTLLACTLCAVLLVPDAVGGVFPQLARVQSRASKDAERISRNGDPVAPSPFQDPRQCTGTGGRDLQHYQDRGGKTSIECADKCGQALDPVGRGSDYD